MPNDELIIKGMMDAFPKWINEANYLLKNKDVVDNLKTVILKVAEDFQKKIIELGNIPIVIGGNSATFAQIILNLISEQVVTEELKLKLRKPEVLSLEENKQLYSVGKPVDSQSETLPIIFFEEIIRTGSKLSEMLKGNSNIFFMGFASSILFTKDYFTVEDSIEMAKALKLTTLKDHMDIQILNETRRNRISIGFIAKDYQIEFNLIFLMSLISGVYFGISGPSQSFFSQKADRYIELNQGHIDNLSDTLKAAKDLFDLFEKTLSINPNK